MSIDFANHTKQKRKQSKLKHIIIIAISAIAQYIFIKHYFFLTPKEHIPTSQHNIPQPKRHLQTPAAWHIQQNIQATPNKQYGYRIQTPCTSAPQSTQWQQTINTFTTAKLINTDHQSQHKNPCQRLSLGPFNTLRTVQQYHQKLTQKHIPHEILLGVYP